MNQTLLALYGLKWNPFTPEVPVEALHVPARRRASAGASSTPRCARVASR